MADVQHSGVQNREAPTDPVGAPSVTATGLHPTSAEHTPATGGSNPLQLERKSVSETVGPEATAMASKVRVSPSGPGELPHLSAPGTAAHPEAAGGGGSGGIKGALKEAWHELKEITPGTKEHKQEYGTGVAMGGYRSQLGKRQ